STDDGTIWKAAANTVNKKAFSSTYPAAKGLYFIGIVYNRSAQVTAPGIGVLPASGNAAEEAADFTNSAKLNGTVASSTSLPSPQAMSGVTSNTIHFYLALY